MKLAFPWKLPAGNLAVGSDGSCGIVAYLEPATLIGTSTVIMIVTTCAVVTRPARAIIRNA